MASESEPPVSIQPDPSAYLHVWEASPLEYLERLHLQEQLVSGLNSLKGIIFQEYVALGGKIGKARQTTDFQIGVFK